MRVVVRVGDISEILLFCYLPEDMIWDMCSILQKTLQYHVVLFTLSTTVHKTFVLMS